MAKRTWWLALATLGSLSLACSSSSAPSGGSGGEPGVGGHGGVGGTGGAGGGEVAPVIVTADWLNQSLTVLDYERLIDGESDAAASVVKSIDLSEWAPGPIEVELTPDGKTAVVSVGPGFFDGLPGLVGDPEIAPGGTLLIVDLESGEADEVQTEDVPMGIAISPDGSTAYTANYGTADARGDSLSIIDIASRTVLEEVTVGGGPEQVALSTDGTLGIINVVSGRGVRVFQTSDVEGTLSDVLETGTDPSDVTFLEGNDRAMVANSQSFDVVLLDTSDPANPAVLDTTPLGTGIPYGVTYIPSRDEVLATASPPSPGLPTSLVTVAWNDDALNAGTPLRLSGENFLLTAAADSRGDFAFVAHTVDHKLSIIDLETNETRTIEWLTGPGPSYVAAQP